MHGWKTFVELPYFRAKWQSLGLGDDDLAELQVALTTNPKRSPAVSGTGGLRKTRFAQSGSGRGKRGSYRIGYVYYEDLGVIGLIVVYAKDDQADIPARQRPLIKAAVEQLRAWVVDENKAPRSADGKRKAKDQA